MPKLPCLHPENLEINSEAIVSFVSLVDQSKYSDKETSALVSKKDFVSLKDGESKLVFKLTPDGRAVDVTHLELVPENISEQRSISKIVIEATDKKTNKKKRVEFQPSVMDPTNPIPGPMLLSNLMLLKQLQGLNTDQIEMTVNKLPKTKLAVHLKVKACVHLTTTPVFTSKCSLVLCW